MAKSKKAARLPVPPPKKTTSILSPAVAEMRARVEAEKAAQAPARKALAKAKREGAKAKAAAVASGATRAMPPSGKDAEAVIRAARKANAKADKKLAQAKTPKGKARVKRALAAIAKAKATKRITAVKAGTKAALIGDLLRRKGGCTNADVLAATGWPTVSMPVQAAACGIKLGREKLPGKPTRYFEER